MLSLLLLLLPLLLLLASEQEYKEQILALETALLEYETTNSKKTMEMEEWKHVNEVSSHHCIVALSLLLIYL